MEELWKPVTGYEDIYKISSVGNLIGPKGLLTPYKNKHGYLRVCLCEQGTRYYVALHILVARAFIENPLSKPQVNHIDFDRTNNIVSNLEWVTPWENTRHSLKHGRINPRKYPIKFCLIHPDKQVVYHPKSQCKTCYMKEYQKKNLEKNRVRHNELATKWRKENPERYREILRNCYHRNKNKKHTVV